MFCTTCGKQLGTNANFCSNCGAAAVPSASSHRYLPTTLLRSREHRMIAGVCGGLAQHYGWELSMVRLLCVLIFLLTGVGFVAYLVAWLVIPQEPYALPQATQVTS